MSERPPGAGAEVPAIEIEENVDEPVAEGVLDAAPESAPPLDDLNELLEESAQMAQQALMSTQEVDALLKEREGYMDRYDTASWNKKSRLQRVEGFNPLKELDPQDYDSLVDEGVVDDAYVTRLKHLDHVIHQLEAVRSGTGQIFDRLTQLLERRAAVRDWLEGQVQARKDALAERREAVRAKLEEFYVRRINELTVAIDEIEANPRVQERLEQEAEAAIAELKERRQEIITEAMRYVASLSARHERAFARLTELIGAKAVRSLMDLPKQRDPKTKARITREAQEPIMESILNGEGDAQLRDPKEIVPWVARTASIDYFGAINFLRAEERMEALRKMPGAEAEPAQKLLKDRARILNENAVLRFLIGSKWHVDPRTKKKILSRFWAAFDERRAADKKRADEESRAKGAAKGAAKKKK